MSRPDQNGLLAAETYARIRDHVLPTSADLRWRDIPWRASLRDGVVDAQRIDKPILLWAMDGHPLGSTCSNGISGRRDLWSDPAVRELAASFVPVADDAGALARGESPDSAFFRTIAEQGHYAGRSVPTTSRQGVYATTPSGRVLASRNTTDPRVIESMLATALERWRASEKDERRVADARSTRAHGARVHRDGGSAEVGLVLRVFSRDLPRNDASDAEHDTRLWNQDHLWLSADDARRFVPEAPATARAVPRAVTHRIARFHLVDNVRGQSVAFAESAIEEALLSSEVTAVDERAITLRLEGRARALERGAWPVRGFEDVPTPSQQERGYDMTLLGHAELDVARGTFRSFELVAAGMRWGAAQYNRRGDDLAPAPMGVVFVLATDGATVPPALG